MNVHEIKLNEQNFKHFHNREYKPTWDGDCEHFMSEESFAEFLAGWQTAENAVLFEGISIDWDSDDFEYQSNPEFPVSISIEGYEIDSEIEADGMTIYYNDFSFRLPFEKATLADFVDACKVCGIDIKRKSSNQSNPQQ